jgi:hypothetical protein
MKFIQELNDMEETGNYIRSKHERDHFSITQCNIHKVAH